MAKKVFETLIIGGGISGLSCARKLHDAKRNFLLITKDIGGRLLASECFCMNYGAAYITEDYVNVLKYVEKREPLRLRDFYSFDGKNLSNIFTLKNAARVPKMIKFILIFKRLRRHHLAYRAKAPYKSIKECFEDDPVLMKYWNMPAGDFIKEHGLEELDEQYGNPVSSATAFIGSDKVNAFYYILMFYPVVIKTWVVSFRYTVDKLTDGYKDKIKIGSVDKVKRNPDGTFHIKSSAGEYSARNIVFAAPQKALRDVYDLPRPFIQQPVYVFYVAGTRKDIYQNKKGLVFNSKHHDVFMVWRQKNGQDIVYSRDSNPDFNQYYEKYLVKKRIHWDPGMIIPNGSLIEQKIGKNLYLASDYNISTMEDCFLTGLYAANQIINSE